MSELHVVIVSFGLEPMLQQCLMSIRTAAASAERSVAVTVIDNGSPVPYGSEIVPKGLDVEIVRLDVAHGFAAACNLGAARRSSDRILFLNNDVLCHEDVIIDVDGTMASLGAQLCGARLVRPDGSIQHCGIRFDAGHRGPYHWRNFEPSRAVPRRPEIFQAVTGAFLMVERDAFQSLHGFDEIYPFAYEDVDLCLRAGRAGLFVACAQSTDSIHLHGASRNQWSEARERESRRVFFARWGGRYTIDGSEDEP